MGRSGLSLKLGDSAACRIAGREQLAQTDVRQDGADYIQTLSELEGQAEGFVTLKSLSWPKTEDHLAHEVL